MEYDKIKTVQEVIDILSEYPKDAHLHPDRSGNLGVFGNREGNWGGLLGLVKISRALQCCGKSKRNNGRRCKRPVVPGKNKCLIHGGRMPSGIAHYKYKSGKTSAYARAMPEHLKETFINAVNDEKLHELHTELALLTSRGVELTKGLSQTTSPPWGLAVDCLVDFEKAFAGGNGDKNAIQEAVKKLQLVIRTGQEAGEKYEAIWLELRELIQEKTKVAAVEVKRMEKKKYYVDVKDLVILMRMFLEAVKENVTERPILIKLQNEFNKIMGKFTRKDPKLIEYVQKPRDKDEILVVQQQQNNSDPSSSPQQESKNMIIENDKEEKSE